ncbi:MAG TPA: [protein-PII] uridylyltransferase [Patescibacteria group bacterium]|nr:[protein-PII] uridylyltransferase [Patescibacteria group bacterium]
MNPPRIKRSDLPSLKGRTGTEDMTSFAGEVRGIYHQFLGDLEARHRTGAAGLEIARACSASVDVIVEHLYHSLREWMGLRASRVPALIALGGFGRRELSPKSDVDLLFIRGTKTGHDAGTFAGYLVRMMWDSGLKLGHSVRTFAELQKALRSDLDLKTALLDGRWLCGDEHLRERLNAMKTEIIEREGGDFLAAKLDETRRRWKKFGGSYHLIEPNVKESPGGIRDYQTIRWVGIVLPWEGTLRGLYRLAIIDREEIGDIKRAFDFLVRVRNELHFHSQTRLDVLTIEMQRQVAGGLGYEDRRNLLGVERFMRDYYSNTRSVYRVIDRVLEETTGKGALRIVDGALYRRVGDKALGHLDMQLRRDKMQADPLFMFKEQLAGGKRFSPHMEKRIRNEFKGKLPPSQIKKMRSSFLGLLQMPGSKAPVIRTMHELGVLRHIFPPFEELRCLKRYDLYHQYTADEHSLQAVAYLEELAEGRSGLMPRIYGEVAEKTELFLATLLHDIGKISLHKHAQAGAMMTDTILRDFPLPEKSRALAKFLVRSHLLLSHFSQRRDMEDRDTSLQFVKKVKSHVALKLLYLLTYADLRATGMGVWTEWKESLLEDLYFKASRMLAEETEGGASYGEVLAAKRRRTVESMKDDGEKDQMAKHLDGLPNRYTMLVTPARARAHITMVSQLRRHLSVTHFRRLRSSLEITICTKDRPFRLSQFCGVITINDLNILGAYAFTRADGIVIDLFHVEGIDGGLSMHRDAWEKLNRDLHAVLGGRVELDEEYSAHIVRWKRRAAGGIPVPCIVEFENDLSGESTVIDLTAADRPGLLYRVTRIFSEEGLDIQSAQITTRGGVAADSFYVKTAAGGKIADTATMRAIRKRLEAELG